MRRVLTLVSIAIVLALLCWAFAGCAEKKAEQEKTSGNAEDIEWLKVYINEGSSENPDFDHNSFDRISFAVDSQGNEWALVETKSFYKKNPSEGLFEANVFEKTNDEWKRVTGGSGGFSEGVPVEVQKQWGIEGQ